MAKKKTIVSGESSDAPDILIKKTKQSLITRTRRKATSKPEIPGNKWTEDQMVLYIRDAEEPFDFLPKIKTLCEEYAKSLFIKKKFRRNAAAGIRTEVIRVAIIATGALEKKMMTEEELNECATMQDLIVALRKALGFQAYNLILKKDPYRRTVFKLARQESAWEMLNNFELKVVISPGTNPFVRYVDAYKEEARLIKLRAKLAEIVDKNIPLSDRPKFIMVPNKDPQAHEVLVFRMVFGYLALSAYFGFGTVHKKLADFITFKKYVATNFSKLTEQIETLLVSLVQPAELADGIFKLPELQEFLKHIERLAKGDSLHSFVSYFGCDNDAVAIAREVKRVVTYVGEWKWRRSKIVESEERIDVVSESLGRANNRDFLQFLHKYPWYAQFLLRKEVVRYLFLVNETNSNYAQVIKYMDPATITAAKKFLTDEITIEKFLALYVDRVPNQDYYVELATLAADVKRKALTAASSELIVKRASYYLSKMLYQWTDQQLVSLFSKGEFPKDVSELLHHSFKVYLWYLKRELRATWVPPFDFDESLLDYVQPGDVQKFLLKRELSRYGKNAKQSAQADISGEATGRSHEPTDEQVEADTFENPDLEETAFEEVDPSDVPPEEVFPDDEPAQDPEDSTGGEPGDDSEDGLC